MNKICGLLSKKSKSYIEDKVVENAQGYKPLQMTLFFHYKKMAAGYKMNGNSGPANVAKFLAKSIKTQLKTNAKLGTEIKLEKKELQTI